MRKAPAEVGVSERESDAAPLETRTSCLNLWLHVPLAFGAFYYHELVLSFSTNR
jgi:hypothetical protein